MLCDQVAELKLFRTRIWRVERWKSSHVIVGLHLNQMSLYYLELHELAKLMAEIPDWRLDIDPL